MNVLGIETSCDETAVAVVEEGKNILFNEIASQAALHAPYGGVYPEIASRHHIDQLLPLVEEAKRRFAIDLIAVANGPGLMGALLMGVVAAQTLAYGWELPLVGVDHVEAHLYAAMMEAPPRFPALGVVISGGHTLLTRLDGICDSEILSTTVDDALGEVFDKVAMLLGYSYPGGAQVEQLAREGDPFRYPFKAGQVKGRPLHFSFSGLKTNVLYQVKGVNGSRTGETLIGEQEKRDIAASFQRAAFNDLVTKALKAAGQFDCQALYLGGGVTESRALRALFANRSHYPLYFPPKGLSLDNGAMIAGLGYHLYRERGCVSFLHPYPRKKELLKANR